MEINYSLHSPEDSTARGCRAQGGTEKPEDDDFFLNAVDTIGVPRGTKSPALSRHHTIGVEEIGLGGEEGEGCQGKSSAAPACTELRKKKFFLSIPCVALSCVLHENGISHTGYPGEGRPLHTDAREATLSNKAAAGPLCLTRARAPPEMLGQGPPAAGCP